MDDVATISYRKVTEVFNVKEEREYWEGERLLSKFLSEISKVI